MNTLALLALVKESVLTYLKYFLKDPQQNTIKCFANHVLRKTMKETCMILQNVRDFCVSMRQSCN